MSSFDLEVQRGLVGGAPPHRIFRSSQSWTVQVEPTTTVAELMHKLHETCDASISISRLRHVGGGGELNLSLDNPQQTLAEAGIVKVCPPPASSSIDFPSFPPSL
jgi:hypothetical protein